MYLTIVSCRADARIAVGSVALGLRDWAGIHCQIPGSHHLHFPILVNLIDVGHLGIAFRWEEPKSLRDLRADAWKQSRS